MACIELRDLSKAFGTVEAVRGLSLEVKSGECLALLGPSGCGKTTTLNMVAGFLSPDRGEILFDGRPVTALPPHRRNAGMVFQSYALFPHLTVLENVEFGLRARGQPREARSARARDVLQLVRLGGLEDRYPRTLSGGQQQRVALARALAIQPAVLLLDEPFSNLDAKLRQEMRLEVREIQQRVGITTLFVTHDQEEALTIADRVAVLNQGLLQQVGLPQEIYARPRTIFVARFMGDANLLPGRIVGRDADGLILEVRAGTHLRAATGDAAPGASATAVVRPEKIHLRATPSPGANALPVRVKSVTYLGAHHQVRCVAGDHLLTVFCPGDAPPPSPAEPWIAEWAPADCIVVEGTEETA